MIKTGETIAPVDMDEMATMFRSGRYADLERWVLVLLVQYPHSPFLWKALAASLQAQVKDLREILNETAAELLANDSNACNILGDVLREMGQWDVARESYSQALFLDPSLAAAMKGISVILYRLGKPEEAIAYLLDVIKDNPADFDACVNAGVMFTAVGKFDEAVAYFQQALKNRPDYAEAYGNMGLALSALGKNDEALASYQRAIQIKPDFAEAHGNLAVALYRLGHLDAALASYRQVLTLRPDLAVAHSGMGAVLHDLGRYEDAIVCFKQALKIHPAYAEAYGNLGGSLRMLGQFDEALASCRCALDLRSDFPEVNINHAQLLLQQGDFSAGWQRYEERWKGNNFAAWPEYSQPLWVGDADLSGKTILLHAEQGLGDTLQFVRYVDKFAALGATVLLQVQPLLRSLLSPMSGVLGVYVMGESLPHFDYHCPLMSLPLAFRTVMATIPGGIPYIHAKVPRVQYWAEQIGKESQPRIGLAWAGNPAHKHDRHRSMPLQDMAPIVKKNHGNTDCHFVSLQKDVRDTDSVVLNGMPEILDMSAHLVDFSETAAMIANLDLIITVDASVAHLAGAMGKPVWILLPFVSDWRWLLERDDSPWYPSARLFRQSMRGDWHGVVAQVNRELQAFLSQ